MPSRLPETRHGKVGRERDPYPYHANQGRTTKLARALEQSGRLIKTLYLLRFIEDEAYRRRILVQLNRN